MKKAGDLVASPAGTTKTRASSSNEKMTAGRPVTSSVNFNPKQLSISLTLLAFLSLCLMLYAAAPILIPVCFAIFLNILLSPLVMYLNKKGVAVSLSSGVLIIAILILLGGSIMQLGAPAEDWLNKVPKALRDLERRVVPLTTPLSEIQDISEKVEKLAKLPETTQKDGKVTVEIYRPTLLKQFADALPAILASFAITVFLTFFLLSAGDRFLRKLIKLGHNYHQRRQILTITKTIQQDISRYLGVISLVNVVLGFCVCLVMWLIEIPNPVLWGVLAMVLNFVPYLGPLAMIVMLCLVGILNYPTLVEALYPPLAFTGLNIIESQLLTPALLGRQLSLSPAVIFLAVVFWGWLWGIPGALLAVPIMVSIKVLLDNLPSFKWFSQLMDR